MPSVWKTFNLTNSTLEPGCCSNLQSECVYVGIITSVSENNTNYFVKVTDSGSSKLVIGDVVLVQTDVEAGYQYAVNDCIKVGFNGVVEENTTILGFLRRGQADSQTA